MIDNSLAEDLMTRCLFLAKEAAHNGNYALGALVYRDGKILSQTGSELAKSVDPTAHPELTCIRLAAAQLNSKYLEEAILVSTLEPCPMCTAGAIWARMAGIVFGASQESAVSWRKTNPNSKHSWRQINLKCHIVADSGDPRLWVKAGVLENDCVSLFDTSSGA